MIRTILWYAVLLLVGIGGFVHAQEQTQFDMRDLYFYNEGNLITRLRLAPKVIVHFSAALSDDERNEFLQKFSPVGRSNAPYPPHQIIEFPVSTSEDRIVEILNAINSSGIAEATPIVLVDNIEAVGEGFIVEPRTPLARVTLTRRLKTLGEFSIDQARQEGNAWLFIVRDIKPPLHIYSLMNLIHEDAWIKRIRPYFRYLHAPIIAALNVTPISGTVDETRVITLVLHVFDDRIKIRTDLLPQFGGGKFAPSPAPDSLFFFPRAKENKTPFMRAVARGYVMSLQWQFRIFAVGEWTVPGQVITYEWRGETLTVQSSPAPFVVTSLVGNLAITDMPSPRTLPLPDRQDTPLPEKTPQLPSFWFDRWVSRPLQIATYSLITACALFVIAGGVPTSWGLAWLYHVIRQERKMRMLIARWETIGRNACERACAESYREMEQALWQMLAFAFPGILPRNPSFKDVAAGARDSFDACSWDALCAVYEELECTHAKDFVPSRQALRETAGKFILVMEYLIPRIDARRALL